MSEVLLVQSLRQRVATISALAVSVTLLLSVIGLHWAEESQDEKSFDARLEQAAKTILLFAKEDVQELDKTRSLHTPVVTLGPANEVIYRFQVWSTDGELLLRSQSAPAIEPLTGLFTVGLATLKISG